MEAMDPKYSLLSFTLLLHRPGRDKITGALACLAAAAGWLFASWEAWEIGRGRGFSK
jgi:hypothetical protein